MDETVIPPTDFQVVEPPPVVTREEEIEFLHETEEGKLLSQLVDDLERPEITVRELMVRLYKKMENYWRDRHYIIWDEIASDWRTPEELKDLDPEIDIDPAAYAKIINVYKAHGQSIIAALSSGLPHTKFMPDDADNQDDVFTAKSYSKLAELIQKRNKAPLLFIRSLFLLWNCGWVAAYNENRDTTEFGTTKRELYADVPVVNRQEYCPNCGMMLGSQQYDMPEASDEVVDSPEMSPGMMESVQGTNNLPEPMPQECPNCHMMVNPDFEDYPDIIPRLTGYSEDPKTHECVEVFSGLNVKFPHWVTDQKQTPYLALETEEDVALLQDIYHEVADKIAPSQEMERYDRYGRNNSDYRGDIPQHLATLRRVWIRPWAFNRLGMKDHSEEIARLKEKYPDGVYVVKINDLIVEAVPDKLDDHWTVTVDPTSNHLHTDPLGQSLVPIQDITNELTNLILETVEFGIPETFYEAETIDRDEYRKQEARPGMLYPAKARTGMGLDSSFYTVKTATLSQEVDRFADRMTQSGQFVSGAFPTIWGGALEGGGGTAKEYETSRAQALQRLNLVWIMVKIWWAEVMSKSVRSFAINMKDDEKFVQSRGNQFINVWIRRAEMNGKVGQVEPEINEAFPISWPQKRDIIMNLIALKNPMVDAVLQHPENSSMIASIVGFPELYIPGDDDRSKQLWEISQLIQSEPMVVPQGMDEMGNPMGEQMQATVPVEQWENHFVEAETCKAWLKSEVGIDAKQNNPAGYMNVVAHMQQHDTFVQMEAAQEAEGEGNESESSENGEGGEASGGGGE